MIFVCSVCGRGLESDAMPFGWRAISVSLTFDVYEIFDGTPLRHADSKREPLDWSMRDICDECYPGCRSGFDRLVPNLRKACGLAEPPKT